MKADAVKMTNNIISISKARNRRKLTAKQIIEYLKTANSYYEIGGQISDKKFPHADTFEYAIFAASIVTSKDKEEAIDKIEEFILDKGLTKALGTPYSVASILYDYYHNNAQGVFELSMTFLSEANIDYNNAKYYPNDPESRDMWEDRGKENMKLYHENWNRYQSIINGNEDE